MKNTDCLKLVLLGLAMNGVWYPKFTEKSLLFKYLYHLYFLLFQLLVYGTLISTQVIHVFMVLGHVEEIMNIGLLLMTHFALAPKVYSIWYRQKKIKKVFTLIDNERFNRKEPEKQAILAKASRLTYRISVFLGGLVLATGVLWGFIPFLRPTLKLPLEYPYIESTDPIFYPLYGFQIFAMTAVGLGIASADILIGGTMAIASGAMDVLYRELLDIGRQDNEKHAPETVEGETKKYKEVVTCVKFHGEIIQLVQELQKMFSLAALVQFLSSSIIICAIAIKISTSKEPLEILMMSMYLTAVTVELLLFCYFGDLVREKSEKLCEGAYFSNWPDMSPRVRKLILLVMLRSQKPLIFTAGNVFDVTLTTMAVILRTSYSYFTVLTQRDGA